MRVVDASVGAKWLIPEPDSPKALALYGDVLHAPDHFPIEVANVLHTGEKTGRITDAQVLLGDLLIYLPTLHGTVALLPRALEIASQMRRSVYDALSAHAIAEDHVRPGRLGLAPD